MIEPLRLPPDRKWAPYLSILLSYAILHDTINMLKYKCHSFYLLSYLSHTYNFKIIIIIAGILIIIVNNRGLVISYLFS